jgi:glycosyltransferase involved in cell wall biosynthesis
MVKVSVIIPVYNAEKYVAETIQSVLAQSYQDFEILVIDDGSPDKSVEVCQQFTDPRITIIRQANRGLPGARNTGIRHAQGCYITFLDADDLWEPEKLAKHVAHLEQSPSVGVSFSYSAFIDETGTPTGLYQKPSLLKNITPAYVLCRNPVGNGSAAVIRRKVFEDICFQDDVHGVIEDYYFDERLRFPNADATDLECWLRISIQTAWKHEGIPETLTLYRVNSTGLSANALSQLEALEKVIVKTRSYAPDMVAACEQRARAYHLRYTARRAVSLRDRAMAVEMINRSLASDWKILLAEPTRTIVTLSAAYMLWLLPEMAYGWMESSALKLLNLKQKPQPAKLTA